MCMKFVLIIKFKMSTIVGILKFITRTNDIVCCYEQIKLLHLFLYFDILIFLKISNFLLKLVEHEFFFYSSEAWPPGYKTFFMLNSTKHEISAACKNTNTNK